MSTVDRGRLSYELLMQSFDTEPCIENARPVFFVCRKYRIPIPENVLAVIEDNLKEAHEEWEREGSKRRQAYRDKVSPKERILRCALETDTLEAAYDMYRNESSEHIQDEALRKKLERFLDEELKDIIENQLPKPTPPPDPKPSLAPSLSEPTLPKRLAEKLSFYKALLKTDPCME